MRHSFITVKVYLEQNSDEWSIVNKLLKKYTVISWKKLRDRTALFSNDKFEITYKFEDNIITYSQEILTKHNAKQVYDLLDVMINDIKDVVGNTKLIESIDFNFRFQIISFGISEKHKKIINDVLFKTKLGNKFAEVVDDLRMFELLGEYREDIELHLDGEVRDIGKFEKVVEYLKEAIKQIEKTGMLYKMGD